ncbi:hypothetical protein AUP41_15480 [Thalassospira xiamenensis]|nr:hypothetical protein AUP41_15480 [Thalassospira xiamenensis]
MAKKNQIRHKLAYDFQKLSIDRFAPKFAAFEYVQVTSHIPISEGKYIMSQPYQAVCYFVRDAKISGRLGGKAIICNM